MIHDRAITISTAGSSKSLSWLPERTTWAAFTGRLRTPVRGIETYEGYLRLTKPEQDKRKDIGGFVGGTFKGERRKKADVTGRDLITLDLDALPSDGVQQVTDKLDALGCAWALYSTRKHKPEKPRIRVIIPLQATITGEEYEPVARRLAEHIGLIWHDPTTFQAERMMYWPSACLDAEYLFDTRDRPLLDGKKILSTYTDWRDVRSWPAVPGTTDTPRVSGVKKPDPTEKPGVIGAFNKEYTITDAMDTFLPGVYQPVEGDPHRFTYTGGSTTGGAIVYDDNRYLCSHHATDPVGDRGVSAFDMVRIHLYGQDDDSAAVGTPVNRLPSYGKMMDFAMAQPAVQSVVWRQQDEQTRLDFQLPETSTEGDPEWAGRLERDPQNRICNSGYNAMVVLEYDPLLAGRIYKDEFSGAIWGKPPLPWEHRQKEGDDFLWSEDDRSCLQIHIARRTKNGVIGEKHMDNALRAHTAKHAVNPVRDYLMKEPWDGVKRLDTLLIDYLGAPDAEYTGGVPYARKVSRLMFTAAVARAMSDKAVKFDTMCVLTGNQGLGKSTFIRKMAILDLFTDGVTDFDGKNAAEVIQGKLFVEIPELHAMYKTDINRVKSFLSQEADDYRAAYGRVVEHRPRRCVFWGTSNDYEYLSDPTGNRRFLPIDTLIQEPTKSIWTDLDNEKQQIWAEAYARWQLGEPLFLSGDVAVEATRQQELHNTPNTRDGVIRAYLEKLVPEGWNEMDASARSIWLGNGKADIMPDGSPETLVPRDRICAQEVFIECLKGDLKNMKNSDARDINRVIRSTGEWREAPPSSNFGIYGRGRGFVRKSEA